MKKSISLSISTTVSLPAHPSPPLIIAGKVLQQALREAGGKSDGVLRVRLVANVNRDRFRLGITERNLMLTVSNPRMALFAAHWLLDGVRAGTRLTVPFSCTLPFRERSVHWDILCNQYQRDCLGFDADTHFHELARLGFTHAEVNRLADLIPPQVYDEPPGDVNIWFMDYAPGLSMFVETRLTRGLYPRALLQRNIRGLHRQAALARRYGLLPTFTCYEPRAMPERFFARYPQLRGARCESTTLSYAPRFVMDLERPIVLQHYREAAAKLLELVPDLSAINCWTNDSCSGIAMSGGLYPGPNGSQFNQKSPVEQRVTRFLSVLRDGGRKINPSFRANMEMLFPVAEQRGIAATLPKGCGVLCRWDDAVKGSKYQADRSNPVKYQCEVTQLRSLCYGWDSDPLLDMPRVMPVLETLDDLRAKGAQRMGVNGGIITPSLVSCPLRQEILRDALVQPTLSLTQALHKVARRVVSRPVAQKLAELWYETAKSIEAAPFVGKWWWWAMTWMRWQIEPLVPNPAQLRSGERMFYRSWSARMPETEDDNPNWFANWAGTKERLVCQDDRACLVEARKFESSRALPKLRLIVSAFEKLRLQALNAKDRALLSEQHDRLQALIHYWTTMKNWAIGLSIRSLALEVSLPGKVADHRQEFSDVVNEEIKNRLAFAALLKRSPFKLYAERRQQNIYCFDRKFPADLARSARIMQRHTKDPFGNRASTAHLDPNFWQVRDGFASPPYPQKTGRIR